MLCYNYLKIIASKGGEIGMAYLNDLQYYLDSSSIGLLLELILVTTCISTIIFFTTKNKYISYLASAPIFYFMSQWFYKNTHLLFIIIAMTVQAFVIVCIQKKQISQDASLKSETL